MAAMAAPTTRLDIMAEATAADPWPSLHALRAEGPVVWHDGYRRWLVTTDRAVRTVLSDFRRFTVEGTVVEDLFGADAFIAMDDRVRHDALRNLWVDAFRKQSLDALRPHVVVIVAGLMAPLTERLRAGETVELTHTFCRPIPTLVIAAMMDVPHEALPDVIRWSDAMGAGAATYLSGDAAQRARDAREDAKTALADYLLTLIVARRTRPGDDLISLLVHSEIGRTLPDEALLPNLRQLLFAGNETTAKWLANILVTYGERPDIRRTLAADRTLIVPANDEVMRWQGVVGTVVRQVRGGPIDLAGVTLADGDAITCLIAGANRDPARYPDPDRFDIHRSPQPNLGFGVGFHNCLGSMLAKLEAEVAVDALLDAAPDFTVAAPYRYSSLPMRGPLPVVVARDR